MSNCMKDGCPNTASWYPILLLRHPGAPNLPAPASFLDPETKAPTMAMCEEHKKTCTVDDLLTDETFERICSAFASSGMARPLRSMTTIRFEPLA